MKSKKAPKKSIPFLDRAETNPILIGFLAGLYPLFFYYSRNFQMSNSWEQLFFFIGLFLLVPVLVFSIVKVFLKVLAFSKISKYLIPFFSVFLFLFFLKMVLYAGIQKKIIVGIFVIAVVASYFLANHFKKWLAIQAILAGVGLWALLPVLYKNFSYQPFWTNQVDNIEEVKFTKRPNVYFIQPDGYVNSTTLKSGFYNVDNSDFENFLAQNDFKDYADFRSNYLTTLTSNSATFMMKHHYYDFGTNLDEIFQARKNIISENPVLSVFRNNDYKTHFITELPYLLVNRPKSGFDFINFDYSEIPYLSTGTDIQRDVYSDLVEAIGQKSDNGNFFFIEFFEPGHITSSKSGSQGKDIEREKWLESLQNANIRLERMINLIVEKDPGALIMIMADHGGFVGLEYTMEVYKKITDPDAIYSVFGSRLSIRWPNSTEPEEAHHLKTSVNIFRILFSYLGDNPDYLQHLQENKSFIILREGAEPGVYEYIDEEGQVVCNRVERNQI